MFELGRFLTTPGAMEEVPYEELVAALRRHASGDWGEVDAEDARANEQALKSSRGQPGAFGLEHHPEGVFFVKPGMYLSLKHSEHRVWTGHGA